MMKPAMPVSPYPTFPRYPLLNPLPQAGEEANEKGTFQSLREKGQTKKAISALNEAGADYIPSTGLLADGYRI